MLDWQPLPAEIEDIQGEFYATGEQEMGMARAELHRKGIVPKVSLSGPCAAQIKKMTVARPRKKKDESQKFVIHRVHPEHLACMAFVQLTNQHTGGTIVHRRGPRGHHEQGLRGGNEANAQAGDYSPSS